MTLRVHLFDASGLAYQPLSTSKHDSKFPFSQLEHPVFEPRIFLGGPKICYNKIETKTMIFMIRGLNIPLLALRCIIFQFEENSIVVYARARLLLLHFQKIFFRQTKRCVKRSKRAGTCTLRGQHFFCLGIKDGIKRGRESVTQATDSATKFQKDEAYFCKR